MSYLINLGLGFASIAGALSLGYGFSFLVEYFFPSLMGQPGASYPWYARSIMGTVHLIALLGLVVALSAVGDCSRYLLTGDP